MRNKPSCIDCIYFREIRSPDGQIEYSDYSDGECRRVPKVGNHRFPNVYGTDWCGEWIDDNGINFLQFTKSKRNNDDEGNNH